VRRNDKAQTVPLACLPTKEYPRKIKIQNAVHGRAEGEGEMNERHLIDPTPELPDDTPIENIRFATRLRNTLAVEGQKTVGEVRETADETLLSFQDLGPGSVTHIRDILGLPSTEGVRPR
jgi:DNA-directed RNA polymerase alpha subunit